MNVAEVTPNIVRDHAVFIEEKLAELHAAFLEIEGELSPEQDQALSRVQHVIRDRIACIYEDCAHMRRYMLGDNSIPEAGDAAEVPS